MSHVTVLLVNADQMGNFYFKQDPVNLTRHLLGLGKYESVCELYIPQTGEDACEEMFDMTNNPGRQYEREKYYGRGRSVSVGDIVEVDGVNYLCANIGWVIV